MSKPAVILSKPAGSVSPGKRTRNAFRWFMTLSWAVLIFYLSTSGFGPDFSQWLLTQILGLLHVTVSPATFDVLHFLFRKLAHMTEYGIFSLLLYASLQGKDEFEWNPRLALWSLVIPALYSLSDEFHQSFEATRTPSLIDCSIDTAGAVLANLAIYAVDRLRQTISRRKAAVAASAEET